jgi:hypothetical protein
MLHSVCGILELQMIKTPQNWQRIHLDPGVYYLIPHIGYLAEGQGVPFVMSLYCQHAIETSEIGLSIMKMPNLSQNIQMKKAFLRRSASLRATVSMC